MVALIVLSTFMVLILADAILQWSREKKTNLAVDGARSPAGALDAESIPVSAGIFAGPGHVWVGVEPSGRVRMGMDGFAAGTIGRIDGIELPEEGSTIRRGDRLFAIRQGGRKAIFRSPVDGVVGPVNRNLTESHRPLSSDPYETGWICALTPSNLASCLRQLFIAEEAREWIRGEVRRLESLISSRPVKDPVLGAVLPDGGQVTAGVLEKADDETWDAFGKEFLLDR